MLSQSDVTQFSQNFNMPKRSRATGSGFNSKRLKSKTNGIKKTWPYASKGLGPMWDPFPAKATCIMRYSEVIALDATTGIPAHQLFRCNSVFDPAYTGIGHQPYGHDTYATIYNHYNVKSSTITVTPTKNFNGIFGISITDDASVQADYNTIRETKGTKFACMQNGGILPSIKNFYNRKQVYGNERFDTSAHFGANPGEQTFFHVWTEGGASNEDPAAIYLVVNISYEVEMWELKDLGQS